MENSTAETILIPALKHYVAFVYPQKDLVSKVASRLRTADIDLIHYSSNEELFEAMNQRVPGVIVSKLVADNINAIKIYIATKYMSDEIQPKVIAISDDNKGLKKIALKAGIDQVIDEPISYIKLQAIIQSWVYAIDEAKKDKEFHEKSKVLFSDKAKMQVSVSSSSSNVIDTQTAVKVFSGESSKIETKMASKSGSNSSAMRYPWQSKDKINLDTRQLSSQMKEFEDEVIKKALVKKNENLIHTNTSAGDKPHIQDSTRKGSGPEIISTHMITKQQPSTGKKESSYYNSPQGPTTKEPSNYSSQQATIESRNSGLAASGVLAKKNTSLRPKHEKANKETQKSATSHAPIKSSSLKERLTDFKNNPQKKSINEKRKRGGGKHLDIKFLLKGADFIMENKEPSAIVLNIVDTLKTEIEATKCLLVKFKENDGYDLISSDTHDRIFTPERIKEIKTSLEYKNYFIESYGVTDKNSKLMIPISTENGIIGCLYFEKYEKNFTKDEVEAIDRTSKGFRGLFKLFYKEHFSN